MENTDVKSSFYMSDDEYEGVSRASSYIKYKWWRLEGMQKFKQNSSEETQEGPRVTLEGTGLAIAEIGDL